MTTHGSRYNAHKLPMRLISTYAMRGLARVLIYGTRKYAEWNWAKGLDIAECIDSIERHIVAVKEGHLYDGEQGVATDTHSGEPHVDHILANAMFLSHYHHYPTNLWDDLDGNMQYNQLKTDDDNDVGVI